MQQRGEDPDLLVYSSLPARLQRSDLAGFACASMKGAVWRPLKVHYCLASGTNRFSSKWVLVGPRELVEYREMSVTQPLIRSWLIFKLLCTVRMIHHLAPGERSISLPTCSNETRIDCPTPLVFCIVSSAILGDTIHLESLVGRP